MRQADNSRYAIRKDLKPVPGGAEQLGHSPISENSLDLSMVVLIDEK